jgi:hypothetical protein
MVATVVSAGGFEPTIFRVNKAAWSVSRHSLNPVKLPRLLTWDFALYACHFVVFYPKGERLGAEEMAIGSGMKLARH